MGTSNYSDECKRDAVQQIRVRGYPVRDVSRRLGGEFALSLQMDEAQSGVPITRWRLNSKGAGRQSGSAYGLERWR